MLLKCFIDLKLFLPGQKFENFVKGEIFALFGMKLKKSAKTLKNEKKQHPNGCFKSIKYFESIFQNFDSFLACFEK